MAAGTSRLLAAGIAIAASSLAGASEHASAQSLDWRVERVESRATLFYQDGPGMQSQAGPDRHGPGSQEAWIVQPMVALRLRQDEGTWHDISIPIDIVSAASPDALDAVSSASRENESFTIDVLSHSRSDHDTEWTVHWGGHVEETFRSGWLGFGGAREIADDNAVLSSSVDLIFDWLDPVTPNGYDPKAVARWTASLNASLSQLLSPTTVAQLGYGYTAQFGELATTWNSVPWEARDRIAERLPRTRSRHAVSLSVRQAIPESRTFGAASYRLYVDDFGVLAHSADVQLTQYLHDDVWLRASYRFHTQGAVSFYTELWPENGLRWMPRTADSDLMAFDAHEFGGSVRWFYERRGSSRDALTSSWIEASYFHYERSNGLHMEVAALGWGHAL